MAKFHGVVGFGVTAEDPESNGDWVDTITELPYYGDVLRNTRTLANGEKVNNDLSVGNSISIVADDFAVVHFFAIRYVKWSGVLWSVTTVTVEHPRLLLQLGEVYRGQTV